MFERIDEEMTKTAMHGKLVDHVNMGAALLEVLSKFIFFIGKNTKALLNNMEHILHPFFSYFRSQYLTQINPK